MLTIPLRLCKMRNARGYLIGYECQIRSYQSHSICHVVFLRDMFVMSAELGTDIVPAIGQCDPGGKKPVSRHIREQSQKP